MWPFKRKSRDINTLPTLSDDTHSWAVGQAELETGPLIIRFNESAKDWKGHPDLPIRLGFAIPLNEPHEGGLPTPAENEQLGEVEDLIAREIDARTRAIQVLALTNGVMKEFVFYVPAGVDFAALHEAVAALVSTHEVQCMAEKDPQWEMYEQFSS